MHLLLFHIPYKMFCFLHTTRLGDIGDTLHIVFCNLYVDERMTSVPRLTSSSTTNCDAQTNESALHIEEFTEREIPFSTKSGCSPRPTSITDDDGIDLAWLPLVIDKQFRMLIFLSLREYSIYTSTGDWTGC